MIKLLWWCLWGLTLVFWQNSWVKAEPLAFVTEEYEPFNYMDDQGELQGISVDILHRMWKIQKIKPQVIRVLPWARSYSLALQKKNTVLFSTTRIDSREQLFKWVCPIAYSRVVLIGKRSDKYTIETIDDVEKYRVVAVRADVGEQLLFEQGMDDTKLFPANQLENAVKMMERGRMDLISGTELVIMKKIKDMGLDAGKYEAKWVLESNPLCFAFHRDVDDKVIRDYQKALNSIQGDNHFIHSLYIKHGIDYE